MSLLSKLFRGAAGATERTTRRASSPNLNAPSPGEPTRADAVPGRVSVTFYAHDNVEGVPGNFLTAVSAGLTSSRQRELVFTVRLAESESPLAKMNDLLRFVATAHAWAREGNLVDEGGLTQFGERGLFGTARSGLLYTDARPLPGVQVPERALAAIFVDAQEVRAAAPYGSYRILARMGLQSRVFPWPTWGDLTRSSVATSRESESRIDKVPRLRAPGVFFVVAKDCLRVSIPSEASDLMTLLRGLRALPEGVPFVLLLRPAPSANAVLVWNPGQQEMTGISADGSDGSRLSGSFLMLVPNAPTNQLRQIEDGYALHLSAESWAALSAVLIAQRPLALSLANGMRFEIEWLPQPTQRSPQR